MLEYWIWFAQLPGLSLRQKLAMLERFSDPQEIYMTEPSVQEDRDLSAARLIVRKCCQKNIQIIPLGDTTYPARLRNISDPPLVLYCAGVLPDMKNRPLIGVVGTRRASTYGSQNARELSRQIADCGGVVVSGGAAGIDAQALEGALDADSATVAVLGCGVDVTYPTTNRRLFMRIVETGCLLSEYPPETKPTPWQFPRRNRIISGMSNGVLVVEAPENSGALITAREAMEQGRDVFVVPGNIGIETCAGSNALLQERAYAVFSGWDIMKEYAPQYPNTVVKKTVQPPDKTVQIKQATLVCDKKDIDNAQARPYSVLVDDHKTPSLTPQEQQLLACMDRAAAPMDEVIASSQLPAATAMSLLTKLALRGLVIHHPGKLVSRK